MIERSVDKMLSGRRRIFNIVNFFLDAALIVLAGYAAYAIREYLRKLGLFGLKPIVPLNNWYILVALFILLLPVLFRINRLYPSSRLKKFERIVSDVFKSVSELLIFFILLSFLFGEFKVNRSLVFLFVVYIFPVLCFKELFVKKIFFYRIRKSEAFKNCIVIGTEDDVKMVLGKLKKDDLGIRVEGAIYAFHDTTGSGKQKDVPMLGTINDLSSILEDKNIELVIAVSHPGFEKDLEKVIFDSEDRGVEVWLKYPLFERQIAKLDSGYLGDIPMVIFSSLPTYGWPLFIKTAFDFTFGILILPVFCILFVLIGIGIKLSSPGTILFKQKRAGLYGRPFLFLKFRTMYEDAEQRKDELIRRNVMKGPVFKVKDDPRIFPFGKFLRKTSLDETPQIVNILMGDMSFIGPRPLPVAEAQQVKGWQRRRLRMKPGLSCLWQVGGRSEIKEFDDWAKLDLEYIDNWSLWLDAKIFLKTIWVVLTGYGAE